MSAIQQLLTEHLDIWTAADTGPKSGRGRSSANAAKVYGISKLRELILELAVRGKLVSQDAGDEPASELLNRIQAEKAKLIAGGKIKKDKPLTPMTDEEKPFELPVGWEWMRLGFIGYTQTGTTPSKSSAESFGSDIPFIKPGDIYPNHIDYCNEGLSFLGAEQSGRVALAGSLLMVCIGTIGKCNLIERDCSFNQQINSVTPYIFDSCYLLSACRSPYFTAEAWGRSSSTTIAILNKGKWEEICIPVPPLAEQHRIVAKVDELMALCDQLESEHNNGTEAHEKLVSHLLGTLTQSQSTEDFSANWQRIAAHFDTLFTTEASINALKQTLLQLAVMGKIVPQDPSDEPASELLKRIQAEKTKLIAEGKIKKEKPLPPITDAERPFDLPSGWQWKRLDELTILITKGSSPKWQGVSYTENPDDVMFVTSENVGSYALILDAPKYVEKKFNEIEPRSILRKGDFLMNIVGASIGRTAIYDRDDLANINQAVCLIRVLASNMQSMFLLSFFNSETCLEYMFDKQVDNARPNLSMGNISKFLIPVPPLAEQHRIVAKVDELMALCDQLKSRLTEAGQLQQKLADVLVVSAVSVNGEKH